MNNQKLWSLVEELYFNYSADVVTVTISDGGFLVEVEGQFLRDKPICECE